MGSGRTSRASSAMWTSLPTLLLLALLLAAPSVHGRATYSIVGPRVLRPNMAYNVAITILEAADPTQVTVQVGGRPDSGGNELKSKEVTVQPGVTSIVQFNIGDLGPGQYNLTAAGRGGLSFQNTTALEYVHKSYSVFIQTDKVVYKPGDRVNFRAVVVNPSLRPHTAGNLNAWIQDGKGNRIQQWDRQFTTNGVFSSFLQLSDQPVLGQWNITIEVLGQRTSKTFVVAEYVLPRFEVTVDLPPYVTFADKTVTAVVRAKYTYGKPVRGEVMVRARPELRSSYIQPYFHDPVKKTAPINGRAELSFHLTEELGLTEDYERELVFDVVVTEELTGRVQNATASTTLYRHKYKLELVKTAETFKPGLKYTAFLKVVTQDDIPASSADGEKVTVKYGFSYNHDEYSSQQFDLPSSGLIELTFYPPDDNVTHALGIEAEYKGVSQWFSTVNRALSPSGTYLQTVLVSREPRVGDQVVVQLNCTAPVGRFVYQVIGLGQLQLAQTLDAAGNTSFQFSFLVRKEMVPRARVVVFFMLPDGEVVADALDFDVQGTFQNTVDIEVDPGTVKPGQDVDIRIKTRPDSYVCLLGVDQAVTILKSGNDISQDDVYRELEAYDTARLPGGMDRHQRSLFFWPGSSTASEVFQDSGVVILTNAYVHESLHLTFYRSSETHAEISDASGGPHYLAAHGDAQLTAGGRPPRVRSKLPETWLWSQLNAGPLGEASLKETAPDSITSWMITAFSVDNLYGLGVSERPTKLKVFRPFFVTLNLPYSVKRGEVVGIQCVVFNYQQQPVVADVVLEHQGDLVFTDFSSEETNEVEPSEEAEKDRPTGRAEGSSSASSGPGQLSMKKQVAVPAGDGASVTFMVTPTTLGHVEVKVTARTSTAGDAVVRQLLVKPEGVPQVMNTALLVDLRDQSRFSTSVPIETPARFVNGSRRVEISAIGDILGGSVGNLERLIQLPFGCGEQNMLRFVPNIVALDYLSASGQLTAGLQGRAVANLRSGYQRQLTYRRQDGSFSAFGDRDHSGSTWLTAFVVRSLAQARPYIDVDEQVIEDGLDFLARHQANNGSFPEVGKVSHQPMQGGSARGIPLTAFTLLAFLEARQEGGSSTQERFSKHVNSAIDYLVRNTPSDPYQLAVVGYGLARADHPSARGVLARLDAVSREAGDTRWWHVPLPDRSESSPWSGKPRPLDIETAGYALLTYLALGRGPQETLPVLQWLVRQRNSQGGFQSTQDTVVGMSALAAAAAQLTAGGEGTDMDVRFIFGARGKNMRLTPSDQLVLQKHRLPDLDVDQVEISASGRGVAIVQVTQYYHTTAAGAEPSFTLSPQLAALDSGVQHVRLGACAGWTGGGAGSNMAVLEMELPSGYTVDEASLPALYKQDGVKRVEMEEGNTKVVIYFDQITAAEACPAVYAYYTSKVARQKRSAVRVYDYYEPQRMARQFYQPLQAGLCDICEGDDCDPELCKVTDTPQPGPPGTSGSDLVSPAALVTSVLLLLAMAPLPL